MPKLPRIKATKLLSVLFRHGFFVVRQRGSHVTIKNAEKQMSVIPMHGGDIPLGTLKAILQDLSISIEDLIEMIHA